jgi:hypothetical protein
MIDCHMDLTNYHIDLWQIATLTMFNKKVNLLLGLGPFISRTEQMVETQQYSC